MLTNALLAITLAVRLTHFDAANFEASSVEAALTSGWQLPFVTPHRLVRQYLQPTSDYSAGHRGVDYAITLDEPLAAPANGVISVAKHLVDRSLIVISHAGGFVTELEPACAELSVGTGVLKGETIGSACVPDPSYKSHCTPGACLHLSLRLNGKYLSPLALIGGLNPSRLLP